ncbi:putative inorganic phosphate cotransporter [Teleopsis dalmanni]|uniref:putative inorganic phosphate cotransporter n=1 Tax=Teleopsis dalmanni TaxID=139649 RepID=UPI0018CEC1FA|nr:putative inorganic phosphate cotransporter [Teleopsis dalmanni]
MTFKATGFGIRHLQCFLLFGALSVGYALRVNLSVAIVAMTDKNATNPDFMEYDWSEKTKSLLLSSFFWGYICTQIPAGQLARKFGPKVMLLWGLLLASVLTVLTPLITHIGNWQLLFFMRVLQGLSQGVVYPSVHTILSKWSPPDERGQLSTYCYSGTQFGTVVMLAISGYLASSFLGWPSIFYVSGGIGILWVVAWKVWGANSPSEYKSISAEEKKFIQTSLDADSNSKENAKPAKIPWAQFFTSVPFLVLILVHSTQNWGFWTLLTQIPSYMKNILGMDIKSNALLSALPYTVMLLLSFVFSSISALLNKKKYLKRSVSRKLFNTIGHWIPMISLVAFGYVGPDKLGLAIFLLTITVGINSATYLGYQVNHIDLSPNYAGVLMGITNCISNIVSLKAPLVVGFIVTNEKSAEQWRIIFFIAAFFYLIGNLLFIIFGRTSVQPWNNPTETPKQNNSTPAE